MSIFLATAVIALAACTTQPTPPKDGVDAQSGNAGSGLRPLSRALAVPPGAPPRSQVPSVRYELSSQGSSEFPDDGVPGDEGPREIFERGGASWYGIQFHLKKTANGERFDMSEMTAAHRTLPFNTRVCVRSLVNGKEVLVRINDRGPYAAGRIIDLSQAAADAIGLVSMGIKQVALSVIDSDNARCAGAVVGPAAEAPDPTRAEAKSKKVPARKTREVPARQRR